MLPKIIKKIYYEKVVLELHKIGLWNSAEKNPGRYREVDVIVEGTYLLTARSFEIPSLMERFFEFICSDAFKSLHVISQVVHLHASLAMIHPFQDGNGRLCRLICSMHLMKHGYLRYNNISHILSLVSDLNWMNICDIS